MDIILSQDVERLGTKGQTVRVKPGHARNLLFPRGLAVPATAGALRRAGAEQQAIQSRLAKERAYIVSIKDRVEKTSLTIPVEAGPDDKLFGAVTNAHIATALKAAGCDVDKRKIALPEPITALGVYHVPVHLHAAVTATVNVWVVKQ